MNDWEILETVGTEQEALLIAGFLESRDVPVQLRSRQFRQEPVTFGQLGGVELSVPSGRVGEARRLIAARRARFLLIDGESEERLLDGEEPASPPEDDAEEEA